MIYLLNLYPSAEINGAESLKWRGNNKPNPLQVGDTIIVTAHFGIYTKDGVAIPSVDYYGLSLGACFSNEVTAMEASLNHRGYLGILRNITKNTSPGADDFFTSAVSYTEPIKRAGNIGQTTYMVQMVFNPGSNRLAQLRTRQDKTIEIVADYGDPHENYTPITVLIP